MCYLQAFGNRVGMIVLVVSSCALVIEMAANMYSMAHEERLFTLCENILKVI